MGAAMAAELGGELRSVQRGCVLTTSMQGCGVVWGCVAGDEASLLELLLVVLGTHAAVLQACYMERKHAIITRAHHHHKLLPLYLYLCSDAPQRLLPRSE